MRRRERQSGFTILEALIALAVLMVVAYCVTRVFLSSRQSMRVTGQRLQVGYLVRNRAEALRFVPLASLPPEQRAVPTDRPVLTLARTPVVPESLKLFGPDGELVTDVGAVDCGRGEVLLPCRLAGEVVTAQYAFEEPCNDAAAPRGTILRVAGAYVMPDLSGPSAKPTALRELSVIALWTEGGRRHAQSVTILRGG